MTESLVIKEQLAESQSEIKTYERLDLSKKPACYSCKCCCNACFCCFKSCFQVPVLCCCRCIVPPKKPSWTRRYGIGVSILGNVHSAAIPTKNSVYVMRHFTDKDNLYTWYPFMPRGVLIKIGKHLDKNPALPGYEWIYPKGIKCPDDFLDSTRKYILYIHGGAFVMCKPHTHRLLMFEICKATDATILSIDYGRAPENPYPKPEIECLNVYKWLIKSIDPSNIIIAGDSAGGALAIGTLVRARDEVVPLPLGGVLLSPWVDFFNIYDNSMSENAKFDYLPTRLVQPVAQFYVDPPRDGCSPIFQNLAGLPPLLVEIGDAEILRDQIQRFVDKAITQGVSVRHNLYPDMIHVFQLLSSAVTGAEQPRLSISNIASFIDDLFKSKAVNLGNLTIKVEGDASTIDANAETSSEPLNIDKETISQDTTVNYEQSSPLSLPSIVIN